MLMTAEDTHGGDGMRLKKVRVDDPLSYAGIV